MCACLCATVYVHLQLSDALAERNSYRDRYDNVSQKMKKQAAEALDKLSAGFSSSVLFYCIELTVHPHGLDQKSHPSVLLACV